MDILDVLTLDLIDVELEAKNKAEVIEKLSQMLMDNNRLINLEEFIKAVYEREGIGETGMGNGIAIPHGMTKYVSQASVAIGKIKNPIAWESLDNKPVELVFLLAVPTDIQNTHLKILSQLAAVLAYENNIKELLKCRNKSSFLNLFSKYYMKRFVKEV